jgi:hypothetical protein
VGVAPDLSRGVVPARSQDDEPHVDCLEHAIEIVKDIIIRGAQNVIALCSERARASGVANDLSVSSVGRAIDFNDHSRLEAGETGNEATENNLATNRKPATCWRLMRCHRRRSALVTLRLRLCAIGVNRFGMARPPTLARPGKGGGDVNGVPLFAR